MNGKWKIFSFVLLSFFILGCRAELVISPLSPNQRPIEFGLSDVATQDTELGELEFSQVFESIEPSSPTALSGFGGLFRRLLLPAYDEVGNSSFYFLPYTKVDLPPRVKISLWRGLNAATGQKELIALVAVDLVAVTADLSLALSNYLQKTFSTEVISSKNILIAASHTHAGQGGLSSHPLWSAVASERYSPKLRDEFHAHVAKAFQTALETLKPIASIQAYRGQLLEFNHSRIKTLEVDKNYLRLEFLDAQNKQLGCLQSYAVHPTYFGVRQRTLSADAPGHVEKAFFDSQNSGCAFLNGTVGNADLPAISGLTSFASDFTKAVLNTDSFKATPVTAKLIHGSRLVNLPRPAINFKACAAEMFAPVISAPILDSLPRITRISYIALGEELLVFLPGEPIFPLSVRVREEVKNRFPQFTHVQILSTTDDYIGYMAGGTLYGQQNLEACSTLFGSDTENILVGNIVELLNRDFAN